MSNKGNSTMASSGRGAGTKSMPASATQRFAAAFENRAKYALRNTTPSLLAWSTSVMVLLGLVGLVISFVSVVVLFFGVVELLRLSRPQLYPFTFDKRLLVYLRLGMVTSVLLGVAGVVLNWPEIYSFLKPVFDWINE